VLVISEAFAQPKPPLTPYQRSSYIAVNADGHRLRLFRQDGLGKACSSPIGQMVAD